jgi:hypothetical protein
LIQVFLKHCDPHDEEEKYERIIEDFLAALPKDEEAPHDPMENQAHEKHMDEESYHVFKVEQDPSQYAIEDEEHEEQVDEEGTQASIPSFIENKGVVSHDPQIFEINDAFFKDLEMDNNEDEPLKNDTCPYLFISSCNEEKGNQMNEDMDVDFQISGHKVDVDCWKIYGDPIYDTNLEEYVEIWPLEEPSLVRAFLKIP